jgi:hypothetical protein
VQPQQLDDAYTRLCYGLTEVGEASTPLVLARLALLLMQEVGDAQRVNTAIDAALDGFLPRVPADGH